MALFKFTAKNPLVDLKCFVEVYRSRVVHDDELEFVPDSGSSEDRLPGEDEYRKTTVGAIRSMSPDENTTVERGWHCCLGWRTSSPRRQ